MYGARLRVYGGGSRAKGIEFMVYDLWFGGLGIIPKSIALEFKFEGLEFRI